ncbi:MAG: AsmA-like C-terminal domain-containing protein, partial [Desulfatitalea sp.]|nr:AsmA-like C-terminal domain-containing protein [Desulfatitalea sp.]
TDIDGRITVAIEDLVYGSYRWKPMRAEATLAHGETMLDVTQANLCGISTVGRVVWNDQGLHLEIRPSSQGQSAQYTGGCLAGAASTERIEGTLDIQGQLSATGRDVDGLLASLGGELRLSARDGRIFNVGRVGLFTNLLSFLSVNDIVRGEGLNLTQNDLPYKRIDFDFLIHDGVAELREAKITSTPLNIVGEGKVDLTTRHVAIILLVSPLTTADAVVQRIPVVGKILKGTLVAVPSLVRI